MTEREARQLTVPAVLQEIDRVRGFLRDFLAGLGFKEEDELKVELALHEICVNGGKEWEQDIDSQSC